MTAPDDLEVDPLVVVLDVFSRATDGKPFDARTARSAVTAWSDQYHALADDPATPSRLAVLARRAVARLGRLSDALDVLEAGDLDDARRALRHAVLGPTDRSEP